MCCGGLCTLKIRGTFSSNNRIFFLVLDQTIWAHGALPTAVNFVHCVCMHKKSLQIVASLGQGRTLSMLAEHEVQTIRFHRKRISTAWRKALCLGKAFVYPALLAHTEAGLLAFCPHDVPCAAEGGSCEQPSSSSRQLESKVELRFHALSSSGWNDDRDHC